MSEETKKKGVAERLKEKHDALEAEYKTRKAKELKEGTRTDVTIRQVGSTIGIIITALGVLGLLILYTC